MTVKRKCSSTVWDRELRGLSYSCTRPATVEHDGDWYCWQHNPERVEADRKKRRAGWDAEMDREAAKYARLARHVRLGKLVTPDLAALLEQFAQNTEILINSDDSPNSLPVRQWRREAKRGYVLAASIREALEVEHE